MEKNREERIEGMTTDTLEVATLEEQMLTVAYEAARDYFYTRLGGVDRGACGFAWVTVYPKHNGRTREGKAERRILEGMGFSRDWTGKGYEYWNPSQFPVQNIDTLAAGAAAAAQLLREHGFKASAGSRLD